MDILEWLAFVLASGGLLAFLGGLALALGLIILLYKSRWRLSLALRRRSARRRALRQHGLARRQAMVTARQRGNLAELAALVRELLRARRHVMSLGLYHQTLELVRHLVATLQFSRLHALHELLATADVEQTSPKLQAFLQQEH